ncbi:MAG: redox-sensing transcriptional repressor Rex [Clostridia bacterium]|nr:redox-sensing transcriptional repressor Rex [Clostridia bacterium]
MNFDNYLSNYKKGEKILAISVVTLERLPKYLRILKKMQSENINNVSSTSIAKELGFNSIQVRKDLACVSKTDGKPGVGFVVNDLINDIEEFLNINHSRDIIVIGAGRLGQALMNYSGFENKINVVRAFDIDKNKCDNKKIFLMKTLKTYVKKNNISVAIITVPKDAAQSVCDEVIDSGIKVIWNFAPINLKVPDNIRIKNEDLSASLAVLLNSY